MMMMVMMMTFNDDGNDDDDNDDDNDIYVYDIDDDCSVFRSSQIISMIHFLSFFRPKRPVVEPRLRMRL